MKVLVDMDGVVVNLLAGIKAVIPNFNPDGVETYDFKGDVGCERSEIFAVLKKSEVFNKSVYYDGAEDAIERLKGYAECEAYTVVPPSLFILVKRCSQIRELGLSGEPHTLKEDGTATKPVNYGGYDAVFEDCIENLLPFVEYENVKLYLINHTYNRDELLPNELVDRVIRCSDFADAVDKYIDTLTK